MKTCINSQNAQLLRLSFSNVFKSFRLGQLVPWIVDSNFQIFSEPWKPSYESLGQWKLGNGRWWSCAVFMFSLTPHCSVDVTKNCTSMSWRCGPRSAIRMPISDGVSGGKHDVFCGVYSTLITIEVTRLALSGALGLQSRVIADPHSGGNRGVSHGAYCCLSFPIFSMIPC